MVDEFPMIVAALCRPSTDRPRNNLTCLTDECGDAVMVDLAEIESTNLFLSLMSPSAH